MIISKQEILEKVYTADNHGDLMDAYQLWAGDYDTDTVDKFGYVAPIGAAKALDKFLSGHEAKILDAGCGTGLVGQVLHRMGYKKIDALDYSQAMLDQAKEKGVYGDFFQADLSKSVALESDTYDAVVCVGTLTYAHVGPEAFDEFIRITKPGGRVCFTIREGAYEDYDYRKRMLELETNNVWELLEMRDTDYLAKENVSCKICTFAVL